MTTATKQRTFHTESGDFTLGDVIEEVRSANFPKTPVEKETFEATMKFITDWTDTDVFTGDVWKDTEALRHQLRCRAEGFYDGYLAARTGEAR